MFSSNHYVPILKAKDGEFAAVRDLTSTVRAQLTPLWEVTPPTASHTWEQHLQNIASKILQAMGSQAFFLDVRWIDGAPIISGKHPVEYVFENLRQLRCNAIPVTGVNRDLAFQNAVRNVISIDHRGVCIRLEGNAFADVAATNNQVFGLLNLLGVPQQDTDVLIDFRSISAGQNSFLAPTIVRIISSLTNLISARTLTVSASSFPVNLSGIGSNSIEDIERTEWILWMDLYNTRNKLDRLPSFGDYTVAHPDLPVVPPFPNRSAQIRYTLQDVWRIFKGYGVLTPGKGGTQQSFQLCQDLISSGVHSGRSFSEGDAYIEDCAKQQVGPGNGTTWRRVGTSHHLN